MCLNWDNLNLLKAVLLKDNPISRLIRIPIFTLSKVGKVGKIGSVGKVGKVEKLESRKSKKVGKIRKLGTVGTVGKIGGKYCINLNFLLKKIILAKEKSTKSLVH